MLTTDQDSVITSDLSDIHDLPLDTYLSVDDAQYAEIIRRIGIQEETGNTVSAFNSSI
jgi:hypothetical protein